MPRPLMRGMARTAVVAGTATAVSGRVARRQQARWQTQADAQAYQQQQAARPQPAQAVPAQAPTTGADPSVARLKELAELHQQGVLTDEEFAAAKAKVLST